jgi:hypothetical protein
MRFPAPPALRSLTAYGAGREWSVVRVHAAARRQLSADRTARPSVGTIVRADALGRGDLYQAVANAAPRLGWPSAGADEVVLWFHDRTPQQGRSAEQPCQSSKKASRGAASAERDQRVVVGRGVNPNWTTP